MAAKRENKPGTSTGSEGALEARLRRTVESMPITQAFTSEAVKLPEVEPPSLDGIEVVVPKPEDLGEEEVLARIHELAREHGARRERGRGEAVAMGDEVQLDILGYSGGSLIPFSARTDFSLELEPLDQLPGFTEALEDATVGSGVKIELTLPPHYAVESLRGQAAVFLVDIKTAFEVQPVDLEDPKALAALGRGKTMKDVVAAVTAELEDELSDLLWVEARERVLDVVADRARVEIPPSLVDEEIRGKWTQLEGRALSEKGLGADEQAQALEGWLRDPYTRADVERRLRISLALGAIARREKLALTPEAVAEVLEPVAEQIGTPIEEVKTVLEADKAAANRVTKLAYHLMVVSHVMERAKIRFEGAR